VNPGAWILDSRQFLCVTCLREIPRFGSGGRPEEELLKAGCIAIYRDPADLLRHDDRSPLADGRGER
jgi:hypothetical protein